MDKAQIIEEIARRKVVEQLIRNITHRCDATMNDLAQIVYEALLKTDEKRIIEIYEQGETSINCYCCAIIRNQYFSDSSRFYYDYKSVMLYEEINGIGYNGQDGRCEDDIPASESGV